MSFDYTKTIGNNRTTANAISTANETNVNLHAVKLGVNYRFGNYGVVAKY